MARRSGGVVLGWAAFGFAVAAAAGAATAAAVLVPPPSDLRSAAAVTQVPVGHDAFDDGRDVSLEVSSPTPIPLTAPADGRVTAFECLPGQAIDSGTAPLAIDGAPRLALSTRAPLWRELTTGARGTDVRDLQGELARLGYAVADDGEVGPGTLAAARAAFQRIGVTLDPPDVIPASMLVWLPAPSASVATCDLTVGVTVSAGATLATFTSVAPAASVAAMPTDLVSGDRVVEAAGTRMPVDAAGAVRDPADLAALAVVSGSASAAADSGGAGGAGSSGQVGAGRLSARLVLAEPVPVAVVPPAAVHGVRGTAGCVSSRGTTYRVRILGSRLGQTMVTFDGRTPKHVDLGLPTDSSCS